MKKKNGSIADILSSLLVVLTAAIIMSAVLTVMQLSAVHEDIKQLSRKYMLEMETVGYLPAASRTQLEQQLIDIGVTGIDFSGTSMSEAGYGNPIYLNITCNIPYEKLNVSGELLSYFLEESEYPITVKRMSTAKN